MRRFALLVVTLLLVACGEPGVDVDFPARAQNQVILDQAGVLSDAVRARVAGMPADVVVLTFESPGASLGHADRAGRALLDAWGADVALVAVAAPGHFTSDEEGRQRFFGVVSADVRAVSRGARERIAEDVVPPLAAQNDWDAAFLAALDEIEDDFR